MNVLYLENVILLVSSRKQQSAGRHVALL